MFTCKRLNVCNLIHVKWTDDAPASYDITIFLLLTVGHEMSHDIPND